MQFKMHICIFRKKNINKRDENLSIITQSINKNISDIECLDACDIEASTNQNSVQEKTEERLTIQNQEVKKLSSFLL